MSRKLLSVIILFLLIGVASTPLNGQGVRITYQGSLSENGVRPTGDFDLKFSLFTQMEGGSQAGNSITNLAVEVADGLFTTPMDLIVFDVLAARWLEIGVRPTGEAGAFTTLSPRQELTDTPYAISSIFSESAGTLSAESGDQINGYAGGKRVFRFQTFPDVNAATIPVNNAGYSNQVNVIEGSRINQVLNNVRGATIAGGGADEFVNDFEFGLSHISRPNTAGADFATVGGGLGNSALGRASTVAGGVNNMIEAGSAEATINGGSGNRIGAGSRGASILGGWNNDVGDDADYATVVGGRFNNALAPNTLAAGFSAYAVHPGAFVWADGRQSVFSSTRTNEFAIRADNGVRIQAGADKNALEIGSGGIKVTGAGVGTGTPAFIHKATAGNTTVHITTIDNVHCNNQPDAILLVTHNWSKDTATGNQYETHPFGVYYANGRWTIFHEDTSVMPAGRAFNVLVIKP